MIPFSKALSSSIGRKLLMGATGLGVVGFTITHLAGNINLYRHDNGAHFNGYTQALHDWGPLLVFAELGLLALFLIHIVSGILVARRNWAARPNRYQGLRSKGGPTLNNVSSRRMIVTGLILLVFLVLHVWKFRFGPGIPEGYVTQVNGRDARDLYRWVHETFQSPIYVAWYMFCMVLLGLHLRHGFWSAFQSLGLMNRRYTGPIYALGTLLAVVLALGFFFIPLWLHFSGGAS